MRQRWFTLRLARLIPSDLTRIVVTLILIDAPAPRLLSPTGQKVHLKQARTTAPQDSEAPLSYPREYCAKPTAHSNRWYGRTSVWSMAQTPNRAHWLTCHDARQQRAQAPFATSAPNPVCPSSLDARSGRLHTDTRPGAEGACTWSMASMVENVSRSRRDVQIPRCAQLRAGRGVARRRSTAPHSARIAR
jgi:hypothetical protein